MTERYQLSLGAYFKRLFRISSAYATVQIVSGPQKGTDLGETECIPNSMNPDWCKIFFLDLDLEEQDSTILQVTVWDFQHGSAPWRIGSVKLNAADIYKKKGTQRRLGTKGSSVLFCTIEKSLFGTETGDLKLHLRGLDMKNEEPGLFGLGRSDPFFELSRKNSSKETDQHLQTSWNVIYRSEILTNILNPMWAPVNIGLQELCYGELQWPIKISVYDYNKKGNHAFMGEYVTSVKDLQQRLSIRGNADRSKAVPVKKEMKKKKDGIAHNAGLICILEASVGPTSTNTTTKQKITPFHQPSDSKGNWLLLLIGILVLVVFPATLSLLFPPPDGVPLATTQVTTRNSYYNDYLRDLTLAINGSRVGHLASLHVSDPQSKALNWLMKEDTGSNITSTDSTVLLERYALASLYFATNGDTTWTQETNFLSEKSVCEWNGNWGESVHCTPSHQVVHISLYNKGLTGSLPNELALLFNLNGIWLSNNEISGPIPTRLGLLTNLKSLFLSNNNLTGSIPKSLSSLRSLTNLNLAENPMLSGNLDDLCDNVDQRAFSGAADCSTEGNVICTCCDRCM